MSEPKPKTVRMKFLKDHMNGDEVEFHAGRSYSILETSVSRWLKRGAVLDVEANQPDEVVEAELDASLAANLQQAGKADGSEVSEAVAHVLEVKDDRAKASSSQKKSKR